MNPKQLRKEKQVVVKGSVPDAGGTQLRLCVLLHCVWNFPSLPPLDLLKLLSDPDNSVWVWDPPPRETIG